MTSKQSIAILGSGIAGLSAAWLLSRNFEITLFEKSSSLGMGQKGIDILSAGTLKHIDVPIRVFSTQYYPSLYQLCQNLGIGLRFLNNDSSFSNSDGETYFRYKNLVKGNFSLSYISPKLAKLPWLAQFLPDYGKLMWDLRYSENMARYHQHTIQQYLAERKFSREFTQEFFIPLFSAIATCKNASVLEYPAIVILNLFRKFSGTKPMRRWIGGTRILEQRLAKAVQHRLLNNEVQRIWQENNKIIVLDSHNRSKKFDYGIIALQANQAAEIIDPSQMQEDIEDLKRIPYERTTMSVHTNASFMPRHRKDWAAVNYLVNPQEDLPVATLWVNKSEPEFFQDEVDYFQTLNPPHNMENEIGRAAFERPVVNLNSQQSMERIRSRQYRAQDRRIFFTGSYLGEKLPLLENGVVSSMIIAENLGIDLPFPSELPT